MGVGRTEDCVEAVVDESAELEGGLVCGWRREGGTVPWWIVEWRLCVWVCCGVRERRGCLR